MQYSNSVYTITGEYTNPKEQTTEEAKKPNGLSIFDNRTTKSTNFFKTTGSYQNDSTIKEINEAAQAVTQRLKLYQKVQQAYGFRNITSHITTWGIRFYSIQCL